MPKSVFYKISKERQHKLLKPAIKEFVSKPYEKITVLSLTDTMNILRTDFYYYFKDKEDIYSALLDEFQSYSEGNLKSALFNLFKAVRNIKGARNKQFIIDLTENYNPQFAKELAKRFQVLYPCGCNPIKKHVKVRNLIYKFMTVTNMYFKGEIVEEEAFALLDPEDKGCEKK